MPTPDLLDALEIETAPSPAARVIWMHGLGADGYDFVDIVPMLGLEGAADSLRVPARADAAGDDQRRRRHARVVRRARRCRRAPRGRDGRARVAATDRGADRAREGARRSAPSGSCWPASRRAARWRCRRGCAIPSGWPASWRSRASCRWPTSVAAEASAANRDAPIFMAHGTQRPAHPAGARPARPRPADRARLSRRVARVPDAALGERRRDPRHQRVAAADFGLTTQPMARLDGARPRRGSSLGL